jgi:hypothetical protein
MWAPPLTLASWIYRHTKVLALKPPTARGTTLYLSPFDLERRVSVLALGEPYDHCVCGRS